MEVRGILVLALGVLGAWTCYGQSGLAPVRLRVIEETPMPAIQMQAPYFRAIPGQAEGGRNVFYLQTAPGRYTAIDFDGSSHTALDIGLVPATDWMNPKDLFVADLAVDPRGGVIAPVIWNPKPDVMRVGILRFDEDGDFRALTWLNADFIPTHVAEFSSGEGYLVTGYDDHGGVQVDIFDTDGRMVLPLVLPGVGGVTPTGTSQSGKADHRTDQSPDHGGDQSARAASFLQLASGNDDAVYLFNPSSTRILFRIQPGGHYTEITLAPPPSEVGGNTVPLGIFVSYGNVYVDEAVLETGRKEDYFGPLRRFLISVYSRYDGTLVQSFIDESGFGAMPIRLTPSEFYFLKTKVDKAGIQSFSIVRAGR